jgi:hypothetical protein
MCWIDYCSQLIFTLFNSFFLIKMVYFFTSSLVLALVFLAIVSLSASSASVLQEYCDDKSFVPTCSASDEVIIMEQATYGRMRLGKCVPEKFAEYMGCSANVLSLVEQKCSGRNSCSGVVNYLLISGICESHVRSYLEAAYSCVKGKYCL